MFLLPEKLKPGTYYFREIEAPYGYLLGEDVAFEIREGHNWAEPVTVEFYDEPLMGKLEIIKTDADTGDVLEGAEFEVIAEKDIITGDGTIQIKAGETAAVLKTDEKERQKADCSVREHTGSEKSRHRKDISGQKKNGSWN